jgi:RNA polymerase sigma-70 factor (ECF subfamily)
MKITEQNFVLQLKSRNEKALEFVLTEYGWIIRTVIKKKLYILPNLQDECVNDVLLAIWENIESYNSDKSSFKNWIAGIARYKAIDCKRKYLRYLKEESLDMAEEIADTQINISLLKQEITEEVEEILSYLNEKDKIIFERLFINEESVEMVALDMNMDKAVIYNHVSRGKKKIKKWYPQLRREEI